MEPVRCFTCNAVLRFLRYEQLTHDECASPLEAFESMRVPRFCCRRMYLSHPTALEEHLRAFPLRNLSRPDYSVRFEVEGECEVDTA